jgi:hypothetical protein
MATVGRLTENGELQLAEGIDTRLPLVTDGLVAHYPFDGTTKGIANNNLLDYSTWAIGTSGSQTGFSKNGTDAENRIIENYDPFGKLIPIWEVPLGEIDNGADGGWNSTNIPVDPSYAYRFSVWTRVINPSSDTTSNLHFGTEGHGTNEGVYDHSIGAGATINANFYFGAPYTSTIYNTIGDKWVLRVAYVHAHDDTNYVDHPESGFYLPFSTTKISGWGNNDARWDPTATTTQHRNYAYYSESLDLNVEWCYPRIDKIDGTEPSLEDLVMGEGNVINPLSVTTGTNISYDGVYTEEIVTNYLNDGLVGYTALNNTNWNGAVTTTGTWEGQDYISWDSSLSAYIYTHDFILDDDLATLSEKDVTFSLYLRRLEGPATGRIRIYDDVAGYRYQNVEVTKEFQRFEMTGTIGLNPTRIFVMIDATGGGTYQWHSAQLEENNFKTQYTESTRANKGQVELPFNLLPPYSISFKHKSTYPIVNQVDQPTYPYILQMGNYYTNASISIWNYGKALKGYIKGDVSATWTGLHTSSVTYDASNWEDVEHTYTFVALTSTSFELYFDGVKVDDLASSESVTNIPKLILGNGAVANARYRDLSIYNKALIASEAKLLAKGTHSIKADGLISSNITSRPIFPDDAYYFDLGENGNENITRNIIPTQDTADYTSGDAYVGGNSLEYNFYQSIGLDWSGDWSICYMKKPIGTHLGELDLTGYQLESLGCNSNSVGGGYVWWGKSSGTNSLSSTTNATIDPLTYFNDWQVITMVKSGTNLIIETWVNDKLQRTRTVGVSTIVANYYETQYGYDFKLGGWDNNNGCYTHFKNLIVLKRAMTQTELDDYRLNKMRAKKDSLLVQNQISTNITL